MWMRLPWRWLQPERTPWSLPAFPPKDSERSLPYWHWCRNVCRCGADPRWQKKTPQRTLNTQVRSVIAPLRTNIMILIRIFHTTKNKIKTWENLFHLPFLFHPSSKMLGYCTCMFPSHQWPRWWAASRLLSRWWRSPHPGAPVTPCHPGTDLLARRCPPGDLDTTLYREKVLMLQLFLVGQCYQFVIRFGLKCFKHCQYSSIKSWRLKMIR